ncbi:MAG: tyrosine-type recombinase/integrase [Desulfitobacterium hafniense]|nr:tyrosine-type recombinase/integrase [Desulfitobacterium hafniense]
MHELAVESRLSIMPTSQVIEYYLSQQTEKTAKTYASTLKSFLAWTNNQDYRTITPFQALDYDAYLKSLYSVATVQNRIATLKMFFKFAMECGLVDKNPFALIKQHAAVSTAGQKFLTIKEINLLLAELEKAGRREHLLGLILANTGMRISEAASLSWSDVTEMPGGEIYLNILRKGNKRQMIYLRPDVAKELIEFMNRPLSQFDHTPIWLNPSKKRASVVSLRKWIVSAGKRAKIKKHCNPHILRHSFVSLCLANKADLRAVQEYVGHCQITTTQLYYHNDNDKVSDFMPK